MRPYHSFGLQGWAKTTKTISRDSRSPSRDLNPRLKNIKKSGAGFNRDLRRCCDLKQNAILVPSESHEREDQQHKQTTSALPACKNFTVLHKQTTRRKSQGNSRSTSYFPSGYRVHCQVKHNSA
jgi:hypothetical protein